MTEVKKKKSNFIMQAGILAAAGILVRIIGILYRSPLVAIIGDEGNGYYNTAYAFYTIILLVSSYSIPAAISKVIAAKLSVNEYKNAHRLFLGAIVYVIIVGSIGSAVCYFFADSIVGASSAQVLKVFAPTIFLSGLLGTFRGYFQAQHTMVFTSYSQILEQILNAAVSIGAAYFFVTINAGKDATTIAIGGAKGSAIGTGSGVLIALIYMAVVYGRRRKDIIGRVKADTSTNLMGPKEIAGSIFGMVTPVVLSTCIYNLSTASNLKIYQGIMQKVYGYSEALATTNYGLFSGKAMQIVNIPIAIASAMSAAVIPTIAHTYERKEYDEGRRKIAYAIKITMMIAIPAFLGLVALAEPVTLLLYPQRASYKIVSKLIQALAITVVFYCLSTLSNAILQGTGNVNIPVTNAAISLVIQAIVLVILLRVTNLGLYALVIATITYSLLMCILNGASMAVRLHYRQEMIRSYLLPFNASLMMFFATVATNRVISHIIHLIYHDEEMVISGMLNVLRLIISLAVAFVTYAWFTLRLGVATESEIRMMPKGGAIVRVLKKMGMIHEYDIINRRRIKQGKDIIETDYKLSDEQIASIDGGRRAFIKSKK